MFYGYPGNQSSANIFRKMSMLCFSSNDGVSWYLHPPVRGNRREKMMFVMMFHVISHCAWLEKIEKYTPPTTTCLRPVTIVHNWKSCPPVPLHFSARLTRVKRIKKTGANLFSLNTATLPVLLRYLSKDVWHGHRSWAQSVGISMFGWKESRRSVPLSIWKQLWPFAGCPTQSKQRRGIMICSSSWARGGTAVKNWWVSMMFHVLSHHNGWEKWKKYATNHVTIVHNWKSCSRCHSMFVPKRVWFQELAWTSTQESLPWNGTCFPKSNHHPKTGANLFISQHSDPSEVLVLHLNKGVGQGHSSLAQSVGISFGSIEFNRSAPISVWKQLGSFGGCPNAVHEIVSNRRCVGHQVTSRSPKKELFRVSVGKGYVVYIPRDFPWTWAQPRPEWC